MNDLIDLRLETLGLDSESQLRKPLSVLRQKMNEAKARFDAKTDTYCQQPDMPYQQWLEKTEEWRMLSVAWGALQFAESRLTPQGRVHEIRSKALAAVNQALAAVGIDTSDIQTAVHQGVTPLQLEVSSVILTDDLSFHVPGRGKRRAVVKVTDGHVNLAALIKAIKKIKERQKQEHGK